eukprot:1332762-Amphidinium_carterae.1
MDGDAVAPGAPSFEGGAMHAELDDGAFDPEEIEEQDVNAVPLRRPDEPPGAEVDELVCCLHCWSWEAKAA